MKRPTSRRRNGLDFCSVVLHHRFLISHHLLMTRRGQNVRALKLPLPHPSSRTSSAQAAAAAKQSFSKTYASACAAAQDAHSSRVVSSQAKFRKHDDDDDINS